METILDKIRKLLSLAQDSAATPGEAEAAMGRAAHLQRTHGLTDEQIRKHVRATGDSVFIDKAAIRESVLFAGASRIGRWDMWIASAAAKAVGAKCYVSGARVIGYGLPADLAVAMELVKFAQQALASARKAWCRANSVAIGSRDGKGFADGFCRGLDTAAERARAEATADITPVQAQGCGTALVMVSGALVERAKATAIADYRAGLNLERGKRRTVHVGAGYSAGQTAGAATSLGRHVVR